MSEIDYTTTSALDDALDGDLDDESLEIDARLRREWESDDEGDEDEGPEIVDLDAEVDDRFGRVSRVARDSYANERWYNDFRFDDYTRRDDDRVGTLWGKYGSFDYDALDSLGRDEAKRATRLSGALKLVQGMVDTFATGGKPYRVAFTDQVGASTDLTSRKIVISHLPLLDKDLKEDQQNRVLTGMACHEASHVRYGKDQMAAAARVASEDKRAYELSNILEDLRIERRFAADYPGFDGIFAPTMEYIGRAARKEGGAQVATEDGSQFDSAKLRPVAVAGVALRYDAQTRWTPETQGEREWWQRWGETYSANDSGELHERGLRDAIAHLGDEEKDQTQGDGEGEGGEGGQGGGEGGDDGQVFALPVCLNDGAAQAARQGRLPAKVIDAATAQQLAEDIEQLEVDEDGNLGEINQRVPASAHRHGLQQSGLAVASIRAAFARSRTGHWQTERGHTTGRLDNRSLPRVASNDLRLFARRTAPSEGRYLVWLLVDCSSSMNGHPVQAAAEVSQALASAARFLPNVSLTIWGWSTAHEQHASKRLRADFSATRVYSTGESIANIGYLPSLTGGGTPDASVLSWAIRAIRAQTPRGVEPIIIMASDGHGSLASKVSYSSETWARDIARKYGVRIVSVAIGGINAEMQRRAYGEGNFIRWGGSIVATAKPLGDLIARIATGRA